jgi:anti-sigma factor RsiW
MSKTDLYMLDEPSMPNFCIEESRLEQYLLGRLPNQDAESVEDHLALCPGCLERADEIERNIDALKAVLSRDMQRSRSKLGVSH